MKLIPGRHFLNLKISLSKKKKKTKQTNKQILKLEGKVSST